MNLKKSLIDSLILFGSLLVVGVSIGVFMTDTDHTGVNFYEWTALYSYAATFIVSLLCFVSFSRKLKTNMLLHGITVILLVSLVSTLLESFFHSDFSFIVWVTQFLTLIISLLFASVYLKLKNQRGHP